MTPARSAARDVVLLTDIGMDIDDQWALAHLVLSPRVRLLAIVTSHAANLPAPAAEVTAAAARDVLRHLSPGYHIPVIAGSSLPVGSDGSALGADLLIALSRRHSRSDRLAVLLIGPATDLALALRGDPALADRIEVAAMGFKRWPRGGNSWNVRQDVRAWQEVVASRAPLTIGCDALCVRDLSLTVAAAAARIGSRGPRGAYLANLLAENLKRNGPREATRLSGRPDAWPIWDEVVVAHLLGLTRAITTSRPPLADDQQFTPPLRAEGPGAPRALTWITAVDAAALWSDLGLLIAR